MIKPRKRLLDTEAVAALYEVKVGTVRSWANRYRWTPYGGRKSRQWDVNEIEAKFREAEERKRMDELVAWLRKQIAEDEQLARDAVVRKAGGDAWEIAEQRPYRWGQDEEDTEVIGGGKPIITCNYEYGGYLLAAHIVRHDPRAVLAQCEAHGALVDAVAGDIKAATGLVPADEFGERLVTEFRAVAVLRLLALTYQHRPGYREEWRP